MFPWVIVPIAAIFLLGSKKKSSGSRQLQSVSSETSGMIFNPSKIELIDKTKAEQYVASLIDSYKEECNISKYEDIQTIPLFKYVVKKINPSFYSSLVAKRLSQKQKIIMALLFSFTYEMLMEEIENLEAFHEKFDKTERIKVKTFLGLTDKDDPVLEKVDNQFEKTYTYP